MLTITMQVVVTYTSESSSAKADSVLSCLADYKYGRSAIKVQADLRTLEGPSQAVAATLKAFPDDGITILVNNGFDEDNEGATVE